MDKKNVKHTYHSISCEMFFVRRDSIQNTSILFKVVG